MERPFGFHHGSFAWLQRSNSSDKNEFKRLLADVHEARVSEAAVSDIAWRQDGEQARGFPTPVDG